MPSTLRMTTNRWQRISLGGRIFLATLIIGSGGIALSLYLRHLDKNSQLAWSNRADQDELTHHWQELWWSEFQAIFTEVGDWVHHPAKAERSGVQTVLRKGNECLLRARSKGQIYLNNPSLAFAFARVEEAWQKVAWELESWKQRDLRLAKSLSEISDLWIEEEGRLRSFLQEHWTTEKEQIQLQLARWQDEQIHLSGIQEKFLQLDQAIDRMHKLQRGLLYNHDVMGRHLLRRSLQDESSLLIQLGKHLGTTPEDIHSNALMEVLRRVDASTKGLLNNHGQEGNFHANLQATTLLRDALGQARLVSSQTQASIHARRQTLRHQAESVKVTYHYLVEQKSLWYNWLEEGRHLFLENFNFDLVPLMAWAESVTNPATIGRSSNRPPWTLETVDLARNTANILMSKTRAARSAATSMGQPSSEGAWQELRTALADWRSELQTGEQSEELALTYILRQNRNLATGSISAFLFVVLLVLWWIFAGIRRSFRPLFKGHHSLSPEEIRTVALRTEAGLEKLESIGRETEVCMESQESFRQAETEAINTISTTLHHLGELIHGNNQVLHAFRESTTRAQDLAANGLGKMQDMRKGLDEIRRAAKQSNQIIRRIDQVALQTKLLAINAAVEAGRAGAHGAGFGVVALEIRELATQASQAARETGEVIGRAFRNVESSDSQAAEIEACFSTMQSEAEKTASSLRDALTAGELTNQGLAKIQTSVEFLNRAFQQNGVLLQEMRLQARQLQMISGYLDRTFDAAYPKAPRPALPGYRKPLLGTQDRQALPSAKQRMLTS